MFKVLIAEDDRELLQLFEHVLVKNGYSVKGVGNGQEALAAAEYSRSFNYDRYTKEYVALYRKLLGLPTLDPQ